MVERPNIRRRRGASFTTPREGAARDPSIGAPAREGHEGGLGGGCWQGDGGETLGGGGRRLGAQQDGGVELGWVGGWAGWVGSAVEAPRGGLWCVVIREYLPALIRQD